MKITKLRLSGFKSFVEPTELELSPGLTGVVGPNGCGKSNLVDALKWVMGETSAKQLRGGEMDDVIFAGTASRPSRVFAEVSLLLDNQERKAPAQFNNSEALEVKRRIDRGEGSSFSVNDLDVRQRDVQTLFADASTGAHSTAIVSQGRIGSLINAKPTERRLVLEEAAGIVGLHARRHEAELKLNAAENNLKRVQDVLQALDVQMQGLKKQARQAAQYRSLADRLRKAEAAHFYHQWQSTAQNLAASQTQLTAADQELAARGEEFSAASAKQAEAAANLPPLRQAEAMRAAALQRLKLAEHELAQEEERLKRAQSALAMRQEQIAADMIREQELAKEGTQELARLMAEIEAGATAQAQEEQSLQSLTALVEAAQNLVAAKEQTAQDKSRAYAQSAAEEKSLTERIAGLISERDHLAAEAEKLTAEMEDARRQLQELDILNPARNRVIAAEEDLVKARSAMKEAEEARHRAFAEESAQRLKIENFSGQLAAARAEKAALQSMVGVEIAGETLADRTRTEDGYEAALAAALGDDLLTDEKGERKWVALPPLAYAPALPAGIRSLQDYVQAPAELARCLAQIGVVADRAEGDRYQSELTIGQRLVTQAGDLWRWDGFTVSAAATGMAAKRLEQRHRLKQVEKILNELTANQAQEEENLNRLTAHTQQIIEAETLAKKSLESRFATLDQARAEELAVTQRNAQASSKLSAIVARAEQLAGRQAGVAQQLSNAENTQRQLPDLKMLEKEFLAAQSAASEARRELTDNQAQLASLKRIAQELAQRLTQARQQQQDWQKRLATSEQRLIVLQERQTEANAEETELARRPAEIAGQRAKLLSELTEAETLRQAAADELAAAENHLSALDRNLKELNAAISQLRESRARAEVNQQHAVAEQQRLTGEIAERLSATPADLLSLAESDEADLPDFAAITSRLERLRRERDTMGPVNLRAEEEMAELDQKITSMQSDRDDLVAAIAKLRDGIQTLNREGRERLRIAFEQVNTQFQELFQRLFGGGKAHLAWIDSEDPLEAGLEIMASPPGKKMQILSLLSGGERALTALALLFAVFKTNPAPICVLDEVDAPLDDANVDRFCNLLDEMVATTATRYLVITHHRLTMARMHRLFGVTMAEAGVSQLVSVDLEKAQELRAA